MGWALAVLVSFDGEAARAAGVLHSPAPIAQAIPIDALRMSRPARMMLSFLTLISPVEVDQ